MYFPVMLGDSGLKHASGPWQRRAVLAALSTLPVLALGCRRSTPSLAAGARIVTLGSAVTEIASALGVWPLMVGVDAGSSYPPAAKQLPNVGYHRKFSVEGVVGLRPTLVLLTEDAGPPAAVEQLRQAGIRTVLVPSASTATRARQRILAVGRALHLEDRAAELVAALDRDLAQAAEVAKRWPQPPRALFIYARGHGAVSVAGRETSGDEMLRLAGARNAIGSFEGFRPLGSESLVDAAPEVLVLTTRGVDGVGGEAAVFELPGIALTPAGRGRRVVAMEDSLLLGFGPRLGQAAQQLAQGLQRVLASRGSAAPPSPANARPAP